MSGLLTISKSAMFANYAALQTTGNNIANANTPGYSRQEVLFKNNDGQFSGAGFFGKGVQVQTVTRAYDELLTTQAGVASSISAADQTRMSKLNQLEGVFGIGTGGIGSAAGDLLNAFVDVSSNPTDTSARRVVLSKAQELTSRFRNAGDQLSALQAGVTQDVRVAVAAVNSMSEQVGKLNKEISTYKGTGQAPNHLLDQRDQLIAEIGKHINITTLRAEDDSLGVFIGGGQNLVLGSVVNTLKIQSDTFDPAKVQIALSGGTSDRLIPQEAFSGGSIAGLLRFQSEDLSQANQLLGQMATAISGAVNLQQSLGLDLGRPAGRGAPIFSVDGGRVLDATSNAGTAQLSFSVSDASRVLANDYEMSFDGASYSVVSLPSRLAVSGSPYTPAALAAGVTIDGVTLRLNAGTAQSGDRFLLQATATSAQSMKVVLADPNGLAAASAFTGSVGASNRGSATVASALAVSSVAAPNLTADIAFTSDTGNYSWTLNDGATVTNGTGVWTAGSPIALGGFELRLDGVPRNTDTMKVVSTALPVGNNGNALAFAKLGEAAIVGNKLQASGSVVPGQNITDAYASALASVGVMVQGGRTSAAASKAMAEDAETTRANKAGVNLDEEAARLIQFQQSYQAAAKILQVAQSIFDTLLQTAAI